jgi:hypothetical protein
LNCPHARIPDLPLEIKITHVKAHTDSPMQTAIYEKVHGRKIKRYSSAIPL